MMLLFAFPSQAQYATKKWGFSIGCSIPTGRYGSMDIKQDYSGWARYGGNLNIFYSHQFANKNYGLIGLAHAEINPIASQDVANEYWIVFPYYNWTVESGSIKRGGLMFGAFNQIKVNREIQIIPRMTLGWMAVYIPEITTSALGNGQYLWVKQKSLIANSPSVNLGVGANFNMTSESSFFINLDYHYSKPTLNNLESTDFQGNKSTRSLPQPIANFNLNMGLAFEL
ncbi:MAG: hypothetical protein ACOVP1_00930 [Bacteroidia bacterium]